MKVRLIVGLGNPGPKYRYTRHNLGFLALDDLQSPQQKNWTSWAGGLYAAPSNFENSLLLKPQTFMNLSGQVVAKYIKKYSIKMEEVLVVHDEADLDEGILKLKKGGGHGGHNGLRSIMQETASRDFLRLRVGCGKHPHMELAAFLLAKAPPELLLSLAQKTSDVVRDVLEQGFVTAQQKLHRES